MSVRDASHAGSWYTSNKSQLSKQLDGWLDAVPSSTLPIGTESSKAGEVSIPTPKARAIIAPHAGYSYSGPAAAWAYKSVDWANAKRVFLLGPSHHHYLTSAATTKFTEYGTPLGNLPIDTETVDKIASDWGLSRMSRKVDEDEHSLEMHLPYIYKMLSLHFDPSSFPPLVPLLIGSTSSATERHLGALLSPYLSDPTNIFVISSDFCHWGSRFGYTYYEPSSASPLNLRSNAQVDRNRPIHESIKIVDQESMDAVETGRHAAFLEQIDKTGNTVCGRHPIGVFMAAVEKAREGGGVSGEGEWDGRFRFLRYERSGLVESVRDSSVSYCSAFAVL